MEKVTTKPLIKQYKTFVILSIFAFAMGILEAIVVVYLRQIYTPTGFSFPIKFLSFNMLTIEFIREAATIVMLLTVAYTSGKKLLERFCYFIFIFGVWDISYYIGLKAFLDWPESLLTWDLLFLIPLPCISPVIAPIICSIVMISIALVLFTLKQKKTKLFLSYLDGLFMLLAGLIVFISFILNYTSLIIQNDMLPELLSLAKSNQFQEVISYYKPAHFCWELFWLGIANAIFDLVLIVRRNVAQKGD